MSRPDPDAARRWAARAGGLGLIALLGWGVWEFANHEAGVERERAETSTLIPVLEPPPPPPPPPPEVEPEVEPEAEPAEAEPEDAAEPESTPQPQSTPTPGPQNLQMEGPAQAGGDAFGIGAGRGNGRTIGGNSGGNIEALRWYADLANRELGRALQEDRKVARGRYRVVLAVRVGPGGRVQAVDVTSGSGDEERDALIRTVLVGRRLSQPPPDGLPIVKLEYEARPSA